MAKRHLIPPVKDPPDFDPSVVDPSVDSDQQDLLGRSKARDLGRKKFWYIFNEIAMLALTAVAVIFAEAYKEMARHGFASWSQVHFNSLTIILASMISIITYGSLYTDFRNREAHPPALIRRISSALLYGFAWESVVEGARAS